MLVPMADMTNQSHFLGTSLTVQWLRLQAINSGGTSLIPGQGTKIPCVPQHSQKKRRMRKKWCSEIFLSQWWKKTGSFHFLSLVERKSRLDYWVRLVATGREAWRVRGQPCVPAEHSWVSDPSHCHMEQKNCPVEPWPNSSPMDSRSIMIT